MYWITKTGRRVLAEGKALAQQVERRLAATLDDGLTGFKSDLLRLLIAEWPKDKARPE